MRIEQQTLSMAFHFQSLSACWPAQEVGTLNSRFGQASSMHVPHEPAYTNSTALVCSAVRGRHDVFGIVLERFEQCMPVHAVLPTHCVHPRCVGII